MFNVVFVLDPPLLEYSIRLREVYDNIIKKFAKALKWEQARTDYVWKEAQNISHFKEKAKEKSKYASIALCMWLKTNKSRILCYWSLLRAHIALIACPSHLHALHQHFRL